MPKQPRRTPAQIETDLAAARQRLSDSIEDLIDQVHPQRIKQRQLAGLKQIASAELDHAKAQVIDQHGRPRLDRLALVAGAIGGVVTFLLVARSLVHRGKKH